MIGTSTASLSAHATPVGSGWGRARPVHQSGSCMPTILIADDEPAIAAAFADVLNDEGYETLTVGDGAAALSLLARRGVDLVIADVMMPRLNGFQLLAALRETGRSVPMILVSAHLPGLEQAIVVP